MNYKKSMFNFTYRREDNSFVLYNTYSKAIVLLNEKEYRQYEQLDFSDSSIVEELLENHILVDFDFDEVGFMRYCHNTTKYCNDSIHLVLAPTMDCNFGCPYCYENRRSGKMSEKVQDAIISFLKDTVLAGTKVITITWYGGEPLLHPDIVENMSKKIIDLANQYQCTLTMDMVTNGYLLSEEVVEMIDSIGIVKIQITLDGLPVHHDARRHLRNGGPTFEKIYDNLKLFDEYSIRVDVRMNVDNQNCVDYAKLYELIEDLDNPNITLYPSPVEDINPDTINEVSDFMSFDEFESFANNMCSSKELVIPTSNVLDDRFCYCRAETKNNYVIDELGYCYKCWDQAGRIETSCFNILNKEDINYTNVIKFMGWDPFEDSKCGKCIFLPLCFGGCKFHRMNTGRYDCGFTNDTVKNYIETTYFKGGE